jgi:hypothetical protein
MSRDEEFAIQQALGTTGEFVVSCPYHSSHEVFDMCKLKRGHKYDAYFVSSKVEAMDRNDAITVVLRKDDLPEALRQHLIVHRVARRSNEQI